MITIELIDDIVVNGGIVVTSDGATIGSVEQIFLSEESGEPAFVTVRTGLFGMSESFVPLAGASIDGSRIHVAFAKDLIRNGPRIESDRGAITTDEESELYRYYDTGTPSAFEQSAGSSDAATAVVTSVTQPAEGSVDVRPSPVAVPQEPVPALPAPPPLPPHLLKHVVPGLAQVTGPQPPPPVPAPPIPTPPVPAPHHRPAPPHEPAPPR
jgi:hypothetical protein